MSTPIRTAAAPSPTTRMRGKPFPTLRLRGVLDRLPFSDGEQPIGKFMNSALKASSLFLPWVACTSQAGAANEPPRNPYVADWSCLSFVDTFRLWTEGVYDAEESPSLPAGAAA